MLRKEEKSNSLMERYDEVVGQVKLLNEQIQDIEKEIEELRSGELYRMFAQIAKFSKWIPPITFGVTSVYSINISKLVMIVWAHIGCAFIKIIFVSSWIFLFICTVLALDSTLVYVSFSHIVYILNSLQIFIYISMQFFRYIK